MSDGGNFRVLVVDDDEVAVAAISFVLAEAGCSVTRLATPIGVTQVVLAQNIDVVLLDLQMPALRGDKLASMLRGNKRLKDVPVVLVSAAPEDELRTICRTIPGVVALPKKRVRGDLAKLVNELAVKKRAAADSERGLEVGASIVPQASDGAREHSSDFFTRVPQQLVQMTKLWREASYGGTHSQGELLRLLEQVSADCDMLGFEALGEVLAGIEKLVTSLRAGARAPGAVSVSVLAALNALSRCARDVDAVRQADVGPIVARLAIEQKRLVESGEAQHEDRLRGAGGGR
jgi:CheY-like chemotaxis protein